MNDNDRPFSYEDLMAQEEEWKEADHKAKQKMHRKVKLFYGTVAAATITLAVATGYFGTKATQKTED